MEVAYVIDLTVGEGAVALVAIHAGIPYAGVALTGGHASPLWTHIHNAAFHDAALEGDELYGSEIVLSLRGKSRKCVSLGEVGKKARC